MTIIILFICLGILFADLLSGITHWLMDNHLTEDTWLIGEMVADNRIHHVDVTMFLARSFVTRNKGAAIVSTILATRLLLMGAHVAFVAAAWVAGSLANEIHAYTHRDAPPPVRALQYIRLMQPPRQHMRHHRQPLTNYCAVTGYLNPLLERARVWARLDVLIAKVLGKGQLCPKVVMSRPCVRGHSALRRLSTSSRRC